MFEKNPSCIAGCFELRPRVMHDTRGRFVKVFHKPAFQALGLEADFSEEYYSVSQKGVLRGLHFQLPPHDHAKLVYCVAGTVLDVVVDLRTDSPTYGQHAAFELSAEAANMVYMPRGVAHGFYVLSESAVLVYKVSTVYAPDADAGIRWDSAGIQWPDEDPLVSLRDQGLPPLAQFTSPFTLAGGQS
jgi:dTDP-4-dehydrorhamnose 3,5-epimerase